MPISLQKYLKHTCQFQRVLSRDANGETLVTTITTTACFMYMDSVDRQPLGNDVFTKEIVNTILFPTSLTVTTNDIVLQVEDKRGNLILSRGVISSFLVYRHYDYGDQLIMCYLKVG